MKKWIFAFLVILILGLVVSCDLLGTSRTVLFYANATTSLTVVSYYNSTDGINNGVVSPASPWSVEIPGEKGDYVLLTIAGDGDLTARIYVDGELWKENTGTTIIQAGGYVE